MLNLPELLKTHNITPLGVIHIGAHVGQEISTYIGMGFKKILMIEADPDTYNVLLQNIVRHLNGPTPPRIGALNTAISDHNGHATLHRMTESMSSSLREPKDHLQVYPGIRPNGHIKVACGRLDTVMEKHHLNMADFNYLHMDIQGGEMSALLGATKTLDYIDAITAEVNEREMYEGCALHKDFNEWLMQSGRFEEKASIVGGDGWGDAFYVRKPYLQMSCIGKLGRFGNSCWQAMFGLLASKRMMPLWGVRDTEPLDFRRERTELDDVFYLPRPLPCLPMARQDYEDTHLYMESKHLMGPVTCHDDFAGYYQFHTAIYAPYKEQIRKWFTLSNPAPKRAAFVMHWRLLDEYAKEPQRPPFFHTPPSIAEEHFSKLPGFDTQKFYGASDGHIPGTKPSNLPDDFSAMVYADYLLVSNSSLSMFAALLNKNFDDGGWKGKCFRPVPKCRKDGTIESVTLEDFDPWNAEVLLGK